MANENLSQNQIDALFESTTNKDEKIQELIGSGGNEKIKFKKYDFAQPDKFNLDNINSLKQISKTLGRNLSQTLTARFRLSSPLSIELNKENTIEQIPYANEYTEKMPKDFFVFVVIELGKELGLGKFILQMDLSLVLSLHRKSAGAPKVELGEERKPLSYLEKKGLERWLKQYVIPNLEESFEGLVKTKMEIVGIEMDPQPIKITTPNDMIALIAYDVWFENDKNSKSTMFLCIPYLSIEPIIDRLTTENVDEFKINHEDKGKKEMLRRNVELVQKRVDVELGKTTMQLKHLLRLDVEDTLRLNTEIGDALVGYIENKPKLLCMPGKVGTKYAVKVVGFAEKRGELDE